MKIKTGHLPGFFIWDRILKFCEDIHGYISKDNTVSGFFCQAMFLVSRIPAYDFCGMADWRYFFGVMPLMRLKTEAK